ncbi:mitochondrial escape protein 2 [Rhizopus stolonifer]|uniref:Mitochondrial escape protein 2 n=1 Tax=Rhizopus stolonifer TaxID=4846 RepID=A0A367KNR6_RHIST|nr:mitochondrial escape protein 2 [Rhizopus stolonifer]
MSSWDIRQLLFRNSKGFLEGKVHQAIPTKELPHEFTVKEVIARTKDGGAIVKFSFQSTEEAKTEAAKAIVNRVQEHIERSKLVVPFNLQQFRAFLVKGHPFLEDILARYPTQRLRIEFQGEPVCVETLYRHLRPYGKIFDISLYPNPNIGKDPSRYAIVQFTRIRSATSARNCLHGHVVDNTRLNLLYERQMRTNVVKEWLVNHPRITIPVAAAVFAGITYAVFDPIRTFFITSKVTQRFNPEEYALYRWLRKETWARLVSGKDRHPLPHGFTWADSFEQTERLESWLAESPETFILVTGHKGSGKSALVKEAIQEKKHKIYIDCGKIASARNQSDMTKSLAKEVGYFPLFTWIASMSGLMDTMITATTGQKTNFSTSTDSQIKNILETVAIALRDIVPEEKKGDEHEEKWIEKLQHLIFEQKTLTQETVKKEKDTENHLDQKNIPVVVIDNFMCRETSKNAFLWEELAEWAALLIENGIAHVVFVSSNATLPGKTFTSLTLSDSPQEKAMSFVKKQLGEDINDANLAEVVSALGGRFTELELLVQKMKMNMDAEAALEDIIARNLTEIRKYGFGDISVKDNKFEWTPIQFWTILKLLNEQPSINYGELKWDSIFNGNDAPIKAMERAELITVVHKDGRPNSIKPGKPIHYAVFRRILSDTVFASSMEIEANMFLKKQAEENITKLEDTIERLANISQPNRPPREIEARIRYLLTKLTALQKLIEQHDAAVKTAKEIVSKDWIESEN